MSETKSLNVEIRRLWPSDMEAFRDHLLRLDPRSRHERFGGGMSDDFLVRYAEHCFGQGDLVYGAFVDGHMCGAAELRSNHAIWSEQAPFGRHIHAEAAFSVEEGYRRRGVGEKLFRAFSAPPPTTASRRSRSSACRTTSACGRWRRSSRRISPSRRIR